MRALLLALAACGESAPQLRGLGLAYGLSVVEAGVLAKRVGLRVGDVVYAVNERRIRDVDDFTRAAGEPGLPGTARRERLLCTAGAGERWAGLAARAPAGR